MGSNKKAFRHSSTYYRRVVKRLRSKRDIGNNALPQNFDQIEPPGNIIVPSAFCNDREEDVSDYSCNPTENPNESNGDGDSCKTLSEEMRIWAVKYKIRHSALGSLLKILNRSGLPDLSLSSKTFLKTPREVEISSMGDGQYWHNGRLEILIARFLSMKEIPDDFELILSFNMDGLPLSKSSKQQFWPILCKINNFLNHKPIVVAVYYGLCKPPSAQEYLSKFVSELKQIMQNGVLVQERILKIANILFICDTPARSFVKGVVSFNHYSGCTKCTVMGEYSHSDRRMSFPRFDCPRRSNTSFRDRCDPIHHKEYSAIEELSIDLIQAFPVADSMHLLHLGIMKRCLVGWIDGSLGFDTKWTATDTKNVSDVLKECSRRMPIEIHRTVRTLEHIKFWKAIEFRTFLLYLGPVALKDVLQEEVYQHFLLLFCAVTICSSDKYLKFINVVDELIYEYLEKYIEIYGISSITSNVHNLCHMIDDVKIYGPLPSFSCYPFENALHEIKMLLRSGNRPLSQAAKRIIETSECGFSKESSSKYYSSNKNAFISSDKPNTRSFKLQLQNGFVLKDEDRNNFVLLENNKIIEIISIHNLDNELCIYGKEILALIDFFETPFKSSRINIYSSLGQKGIPEYSKVINIKCKMIRLF